MTAMLHDLCVMSCYGAADPGNVAFINALDRSLAQRGVKLLVLVTQANPAIEALAIEVPYLLSGFDAALADTGRAPFHPLDATLESETLNAGAQDAQAVARGIAKCEAFYSALGTLARPCAALVWNTTLPHGRIARNSLSACGVPAYCIERGWLPRTYQLNQVENNSYNDFFTDFALSQDLPGLVAQHALRREPFDAAVHYYEAQAVQKYDAGAVGTPRQLREKYGIGDAPLIVCFSASAGSSIGAPRQPSMAYSSPLFGTTTEALAMLADLLAPFPDVRVLVQEHPIDRLQGRAAALPAGFLCSSGENIHGLLAAADRLAFIGTTTVQVEALLRDTPRLSMSRHVASRVGASYGLVEEGPSAVAAWMAHDRAQETATAARGLVNLLCADRLVRAPGGPGFIRRDVDDLAQFVASLALRQQPAAEQRIMAFVEEVSGLLSQG